jgi:IS30 family transposase
VDRISDRERRRVAELVAEGASAWRLQQEIHRSRYAIRRAVIALQRPAVKPPTRSPVRLSLVEREEISRGLVAGLSLRAIARQLQRSPSTISREVRANGGPSRYRAHRSDRRALRLARRPKPAKLAVNARLREIVETKLELRWSPQQISGYLRSGRAHRRPAGLSVNNGQGQLRGAVHISQRPAAAEDRAVPGHWESQWCCQAA